MSAEHSGCIIALYDVIVSLHLRIKGALFMLKFKTSLMFIIFSGLFVACANQPKVVELAITSDPQVELDRVASNIKAAEQNQVDVLSPENFKSAKKSWGDAVKARADNDDQKDVLYDIALSQAYLDQANEVAKIPNQVLRGPIEARQDALAAKAHVFFARETKEADEKFKKVTRQIEKNDTSGADENRPELVAVYRDLELRAIKKDKLGAAKATIESAVSEGASELTPETLAWANKQYADNEALIVANRHNRFTVNEASEKATFAANRLLKMVRDAKGSAAKNPEDLARQVERSERAAAQSERALDEANSNLATSQGTLATETSRNAELESKLWLDKEYESALSQFSTDEAEVYRQGDKLLLRLKGLTFGSNKAGINADNFSLLAKVQKVIGDIGSSQVVIEGHTDSIGGKKLNTELSQKRAEAVQAYLISNNNVPPNKITAMGLGDSKPIATNKTASGRAQNRRVDVIISANPMSR